MEQKPINTIYTILLNEYPDAKSGLNYNTAFELLIAVMLSAQCTDKRVNKVTIELFNKAKTPEELLALGEKELEDVIKPCGLYKSKSRNIADTCRILIDKFKGNVPDEFEELIKLPGVGRKTANVVLIEAFDIPAIPVDTHVFRVSNRIGLAHAKNPEQAENQLSKTIPKGIWIKMHHLLITHGRKTCMAKKPKCDFCKINKYCDFTKQIIK
ncbi:MAG: endonuclease III [Deltaproteobacteria bacterium]